METERADQMDESHDGGFRAAVEALMARIVAGERSAVWELHTLAEPALRRVLRAEARRIDVRIGDEDILDLTLDAAVDLGKLAHAWDPDGALPWVWARKRITALVHAHVGTFADELDETHLQLAELPVVARMEDPRGLLRRLAERHPSAQLLERRLSAVASDRDAEIWLGVQIERAAGNRSPAVTVAVNHDMQPGAVRKVIQRVAERLAAAA
jgi:hypothetical protein